MSENIQSISQGTYTIGNTNELTFSAGPGIKIDSPSEGVVRIGNDETVLWSGTYNTATKSIVFSEPVTNFNSVKILWQHMNPNFTIRWSEYSPSCRFFEQIQGRNTGGSAAANFYTFHTYWTNNTSGMTFYYDIIQTSLTGQVATKTGGYNEVNPVKVVGINRISGSNA